MPLDMIIALVNALGPSLSNVVCVPPPPPFPLPLVFPPPPTLSISDLKADGKDFEVVFVSSDRDDASFLEYYGEMPWLALPLRDRARAAALSDKFKVSGIPTLVRSRALLLRCCCRMNGLGWETGGVALCFLLFRSPCVFIREGAPLLLL